MLQVKLQTGEFLILRDGRISSTVPDVIKRIGLSLSALPSPTGGIDIQAIPAGDHWPKSIGIYAPGIDRTKAWDLLLEEQLKLRSDLVNMGARDAMWLYWDDPCVIPWDKNGPTKWMALFEGFLLGTARC